MTPSDAPSGWTFVHGTAVVIREHGVVVRGPSGAGKSRLAECLIDIAEGRGWFARLVGDDRVGLATRGDRLLVRGHAAVAGLIERRTQGLVSRAFEPVAVCRLVVDLVGAQDLPRLPEHSRSTAELLGISVPGVVLAPDPIDRACGTIFAALRQAY